MNKTRRKTPFLTPTSMSLILAACGGGGGGGGGGSTNPARTQSRFTEREGRVVDGPIVDADPTTGQTGDINFWLVDYIQGFSGYAFYPNEVASYIFLNGSSLATVTSLTNFPYAVVESFRNIYLHEIAHSLGLAHPFEEAGMWPGDQEYRNSVDTLMSYSSATNTHGLKQADIDALQWLYGAPGEHGTGAEFLPEIA